MLYTGNVLLSWHSTYLHRYLCIQISNHGLWGYEILFFSKIWTLFINFENSFCCTGTDYCVCAVIKNALQPSNHLSHMRGHRLPTTLVSQPAWATECLITPIQPCCSEDRSPTDLQVNWHHIHSTIPLLSTTATWNRKITDSWELVHRRQTAVILCYIAFFVLALWHDALIMLC